MKTRKPSYSAASIALHWLMLLLLVAVYATMEFKSIFPKGSASREAMVAWHYTLGLSVFLLVWFRMLARLVGPHPVVEPALPPWQARLATLTHWTLYALMIGLPVLGFLALNAKGTPVMFLGEQLPALIGKSRGLGKVLEDIHEAVATAGYFLVGLHAAAALYHHYVRRDNTLRLMLPRLVRP